MLGQDAMQIDQAWPLKWEEWTRGDHPRSCPTPQDFVSNFQMNFEKPLVFSSTQSFSLIKFPTTRVDIIKSHPGGF